MREGEHDRVTFEPDVATNSASLDGEVEVTMTKTRLKDMLRSERQRRNWTEEQAADFFGVNQSSYHRWEQGPPEGNLPGKSNLVKVADFVGVTLEEAYQLKYSVDAPVTLTDALARISMLERDQEELRDEIAGLRRQVATNNALLEGLISRLGRPEFVSEVGRLP